MKTEYLVLVAGMGVVSFLPRWIPLFFLSRKELPEWLEEWLGLIPVSILSALLFPCLVTGGEPRMFDLSRPELLVAIPTFAVAWKTRSLAGTLVAGMGFFWAAGRLLG